MKHKFSIAIHGGAGTILQSEITAEQEVAYKQGLKDALYAGFAILETSGKAIDAVVAAVEALENNILFNAGKGSVFTNRGLHEMDAAVMDGHNLSAGAVAGVQHVQNPVLLANEIMLHSNHVFLSGDGALDFAKQQQLPLADEAYFYSQYRHEQWKQIMNSDNYQLDHNVSTTINKEKKFGTVGAVACDENGNIAAATSTGGMTNKRFGRIGDSPIIGAGTYANNTTCAISCTGHGELFIKAVAAYDVSCLMEYGNYSLEEAMHIVVHEKLVEINGEGGMVGVDAAGNISMQFNCEGMYRAAKNSEGLEAISIYKDE